MRKFLIVCLCAIGVIAFVMFAVVANAPAPKQQAQAQPVQAQPQPAQKPPPPPPPAPTCANDWALCTSVADLANTNHAVWSKIAVRCKREANNRAKYGDPEWPNDGWLSSSFSHFINDSGPLMKQGIVTAVEPDARFFNGFNAKVRSRVACTYDLKADKIVDLTIKER